MQLQPKKPKPKSQPIAWAATAQVAAGSWKLEAPKWRTASKMMSPPARAKVHDIGFGYSDRKAERKIHREKERAREGEP